jgi:hypothetical protein
VEIGLPTIFDLQITTAFFHSISIQYSSKILIIHFGVAGRIFSCHKNISQIFSGQNQSMSLFGEIFSIIFFTEICFGIGS